MTIRLLLTSVGGAMSPYTIQRFQACAVEKVEVVGVDANPEALGRHAADDFAVVPPGSDPGYVDAILAIAARTGATLILPCSDEEASALAGAAARLAAAGLTLLGPGAAAIAVMSDKRATLSVLGAAGVPVPEWRICETTETMVAEIDALLGRHGRIAVKPIRSRGSRDVFVLEPGRAAAEQPPGHRETYLSPPAFLAELPLRPVAGNPVMVMQGLSAPAHDTDVLARAGKVLRAVPRRRVNPAGIPFRGGEILDDPRLLAIAEGVAAALSADWLFDIDTMSDEQGRPLVVEVNPRPSGSLSAATAAGVPILDDLIALATGRTLPPAPALPNGRTVLPFTSILVAR